MSFLSLGRVGFLKTFAQKNNLRFSLSSPVICWRHLYIKRELQTALNATLGWTQAKNSGKLNIEIYL